MSNLVRCAAVAIALSLLAAGAQAQSKYPSKPIRLLTPFAAGGGSDILARLIGPHITEAFGQPVVVDNRPGDRKSTRLNSSHIQKSRMPSSA